MGTYYLLFCGTVIKFGDLMYMAQNQGEEVSTLIKRLHQVAETLEKGGGPAKEMSDTVKSAADVLDLMHRNVYFFVNKIVNACEKDDKQSVLDYANTLKQVVTDLLD